MPDALVDSTPRFRDRAEVERSLVDNGFATLDVRDAPDRPGLADVFVAEAVSPGGPSRSWDAGTPSGPGR